MFVIVAGNPLAVVVHGVRRYSGFASHVVSFEISGPGGYNHPGPRWRANTSVPECLLLCAAFDRIVGR
jgi:hypothetical protein